MKPSHLLQSEETMKAVRNLIIFFICHPKQQESLLENGWKRGQLAQVNLVLLDGGAFDYLLCLKRHLSLLKNDGELQCNITDLQWRQRIGGLELFSGLLTAFQLHLDKLLKTHLNYYCLYFILMQFEGSLLIVCSSFLV
jgi:hypothetical protein